MIELFTSPYSGFLVVHDWCVCLCVCVCGCVRVCVCVWLKAVKYCEIIMEAILIAECLSSQGSNESAIEGQKCKGGV